MFLYFCRLKIACIDKWAKSKFDNATPPDLCSGPKLAIWNKNQQPGFKKTPMTGEKSEMDILLIFGCGRPLGEKATSEYNDSCSTVFKLYDIYTPQTSARHPKTHSRHHTDTPRQHPDTPRYRRFCALDEVAVAVHWFNMVVLLFNSECLHFSDNCQMANSGSKRSKRLSGEPPLDEDFHFPPLKAFNPPDKLPSNASIIGRLRMLSGGGKQNMPIKKAMVEVAKEVESKYFHDTIFCKSSSSIVKAVGALYKIYSEGKVYAKAGRMNLSIAQQYVELIKTKDQLFDVSTDDPERKKHLELSWGVKMGVREKLYLEDQKGARQMACDSGVDPTFFRAFMTQQRLKERDEEYRARREEALVGKNMEQVEEWLRSEGDIPSASPESVATPVKSAAPATETPQVNKAFALKRITQHSLL